MNNRLTRKAKRILAAIIAVMMIVTMLPVIPVVAEDVMDRYPYVFFASSNEEGSITINASHFCINGNIATNGTIVSSANMNVNGTRTEYANEEMIFILNKLNNICFSGDNVGVYLDDYSYEDTNININVPMDVQGKLNLTGNINVTTGIKAFEDLLIDGDVINTNNSVICSETGDVYVKGTNINLNGLIYAPYGEVIITAQNLNLNNVIVIADTITINCSSANVNYSSSMAELVGNKSDKIIEIYSYGEYDAENHSIDIKWYTNYSSCNYEIMVSDDNVDYISVDHVSGENTYQYHIVEDFKTKYFKVSLITDYAQEIESIPFVVTKHGDEYFVDFLDSDGDGLVDVYEMSFGTDACQVDTDVDGLNDYQEVCITDTEPTKYDSVDERISDSDVDLDGDNLSNLKEIELGTSPQKIDTDDDTINDYDEVYSYNTNPLMPDTDSDTILDRDELNIGLNPTNPETFGVPDGEYKVLQTISADSGALAEINTSESPFKLSIDIIATGYVEGKLKASETGYSKVIQNDSMLGIAPELVCSNANNIYSITLKFEISSEYIENTMNIFPGEKEFTGIKRFNIFKYFEDVNMLIPIETEFDVDNNIIYANVDELGTYCVMDMEKWLNGFDVPEEVQLSTPTSRSLLFKGEAVSEFTEEDMIMTFSGEAKDMELLDTSEDVETLNSEITMLMSDSMLDVTPIDVAFLLQTSGQLENTFSSQKDMIVYVIEKLIQQYGSGNVRFCIVTYNLSGADILKLTNDEIWFTNPYELQQRLEDISYQYTTGYTDRSNAFKKLQNNIEFKEHASKFVFQVMNGSTNVGTSYFDQINTCARLNINYSELMPSGYSYISSSYGQQVSNAIASTNGMDAVYSADSLTQVYNHICTHTKTPQIEFNAIVPTGWKTIILDGAIDPENGINSDTDELIDWEEIDTNKLRWDTDGSIILPTVQQCIDYATKPYAEDGLSRFKSEQWSSGMTSSFFEMYLSYVLNNTYILPILSDPTDGDTDGDGLDDVAENIIGTSVFDFDSDGDFVDDEEENFLGLDPLSVDSDCDNLDDGLELSIGYDPLNSNCDNDEYDDYDEYINGTDPYVYEYKQTVDEHVGAITYGIIFGDFADDEVINIDVLIGQIGGSFIPIVADARDTIANVIKGDWEMAGLSAIGLIPVVGDAGKTLGKLGQAIVKIGDDIPTITKLLIGIAEKNPDLIKLFSKSDEVAEAIRKACSNQEVTKESLVKIVKYADEAGITILKSSDLLKSSDEVLEGVKDVWSKKPWERGKTIDEFLNNHKLGEGLGENFPVVDRLENGVLISTKSLDLGAKSYKNPETLRKRLQSYINALDGFETKYPDVNTVDGFKWGSTNALKSTDYSSKVLELVLPDMPMTSEQAAVIRGFVEKYNISIVIMKG